MIDINDWPFAWWQVLGTYLVGCVATDLFIVWWCSRYAKKITYECWVEESSLRFTVSILWPIFLVKIVIETFLSRTGGFVSTIYNETLAKIEKSVNKKMEEGDLDK